MAYEVDEIKFLKEEGFDWWTTIKKVPIRLLDQNFGYEVPISDLTDSSTIEKPEDPDVPSTSGKGKKDVPEPVKKLCLDSFKMKPDAMTDTGYSKVTFGDNYFEAEICCNQFPTRTFVAKIEKGFLVMAAEAEKEEGDGTVWRRFERRYMLPHDCHFSSIKRQVTAEYIEGGLKVSVLKHDPERPHIHHAIKPAGFPLRSPSLLKSPQSSPQAPKSPPKEKPGPSSLKTPPKEKPGPSSLKTPPKEKQGPSTLKTPPKEK